MSATPAADNRVIKYGVDPFNLVAQNGQTVAVEITVEAAAPVTYLAGAGADYDIPGITFDNAGELSFASSSFYSTRGLACKAALLALGTGDTFDINSMYSGGSGVWTATLTSAFTSSNGGTTYVATYTASVAPSMYSWEITV
jgi:hypothetical protein